MSCLDVLRWAMREAQWQSKGFAKELRRNQPDAEKKLWSGLRNKRLGGHRFRRQHPIDNFIVDFACLKAKFIIELDGPTHESDEQKLYDANVVFDNLNDVLDDIALQLNLME